MQTKNKIEYSNYGEYLVSDKLELFLPKTQIIIEKKENRFSYYRKNSENKELTKSISGKKDKIRIELAPILPLNLPAKKTKDLMFLRLAESVFVEKDSMADILVEFPVEIGIFVVNSDNSKDFFDCFTCEPMHSRFALYGTPDKGKLCMYGKVKLLEESEKPEPYVFAKMKVTITNKLNEGQSVGKLIFSLTHHNIYYLDNVADAHIDDISALIKKEEAIKIIEIKHVEYSKKDNNWKLAPRASIKSEKRKFSMDRGFD
ncbi:MAG: DUF432 domain-containing protein [Nitrosopumilus sp.]|nr:DUF432 domain-containing protein [Nitrosopumilus sp.]MDH3854624.1 DUF432 domain-containing protein [Nitrosopumilus sp.]